MSAVACPGCGGERLVGDPTGMRWDHGNDCTVRAAEDATQHADGDRLRERYGAAFARPTTDAEHQLLAACGVVLPAGATTTVAALTGAVRWRGWAGVDLDVEHEPAGGGT